MEFQGNERSPRYMMGVDLGSEDMTCEITVKAEADGSSRILKIIKTPHASSRERKDP